MTKAEETLRREFVSHGVVVSDDADAIAKACAWTKIRAKKIGENAYQVYGAYTEYDAGWQAQLFLDMIKEVADGYIVTAYARHVVGVQVAWIERSDDYAYVDWHALDEPDDGLDCETLY